MAFLRTIFANHLSRELKELYLSSAIIHFATSAITLFEPIYLLRVGLSLGDVLAFYGILYVLYFFGLPLGGRLARLFGYEHVILWSSPFLILYYLALFAIPYHPIFLVVALLSLVIQKILYWPGYHADFARFGNTGERGREMSSFGALLSAVAICGPIFGGFVIAFAGFKTLFIITAILILVSNIPLLTTPEKFVPVDFSYAKALKEVFVKKNIRQSAAFLGYAEDLISNIVWPIFIATVIKSLFSVGALVSVSTLLNVIIIIIVGKVVDTHRRLPIARLGTVLTSLVWFGRTLVRTGFGVFLFDNFYRIARHILGISMITIIYDEAKQSSVMGTIIFREMGLAFAKAVGAGVAIGVWILMPNQLNVLFVVAGLMNLFFLLLAERSRKDGMMIAPAAPDVVTPITPIK